MSEMTSNDYGRRGLQDDATSSRQLWSRGEDRRLSRILERARPAVESISQTHKLAVNTTTSIG